MKTVIFNLELNIDFPKPKQSKKLFKAVENRDLKKILKILKIPISDIYNYTFESASCVIGFKNKVCLEICVVPEILDYWHEPDNPLFKSNINSIFLNN